jgi:hypothetical protein
MKKFVYHVFLVFSLLGVLFIPFSFRCLQFQDEITKFLFEDVILFIASVFDFIRISNPEVTSDSTTFYLLMVVLFFIAIILLALLSRLDLWKKHEATIVKGIQLVLTFYLSVIMLKYGFDKIFKAQFYLPEPNTLFTPLGMLDKDIAYWSTMGASRTYSIFMGFAEVIPAILLFFTRTRILGLFILWGVLTNVVFVNFGFDISVKLYSSFLWLICFLLLVPSLRSMISFFVLNKSTTLTSFSGKSFIESRTKRIVLKGALLFLFLIESLSPYVISGQYNDDETPRNPLHGAYKVVDVEMKEGEEDKFEMDLSRLFVHRNNYLILQYDDDRMEDFHLEMDSSKEQFILTNYEGEKMVLPYKYSETTKTLVLEFSDLGMMVYAESIPWRELPLLQPLFHWTVDEIK